MKREKRKTLPYPSPALEPRSLAPSACPHCGTGADGVTLGLVWDYYEHCWRCVICGYRGYEHLLRPKTKAEVVAERIWDEILDGLDEEENQSLLRVI